MNISLLSVDPDTIEQAHGLTEKYGLKPRDALHDACATRKQL